MGHQKQLLLCFFYLWAVISDSTNGQQSKLHNKYKKIDLHNNIESDCICVHNSPNKRTMSQIVDPSKSGLDRVIVFIYRDSNGYMQLYVPGLQKQAIIPELQIDSSDLTLPVSKEITFESLFNNPNRVLHINPIRTSEGTGVKEDNKFPKTDLEPSNFFIESTASQTSEVEIPHLSENDPDNTLGSHEETEGGHETHLNDFSLETDADSFIDGTVIPKNNDNTPDSIDKDTNNPNQEYSFPEEEGNGYPHENENFNQVTIDGHVETDNAPEPSQLNNEYEEKDANQWEANSKEDFHVPHHHLNYLNPEIIEPLPAKYSYPVPNFSHLNSDYITGYPTKNPDDVYNYQIPEGIPSLPKNDSKQVFSNQVNNYLPTKDYDEKENYAFFNRPEITNADEYHEAIPDHTFNAYRPAIKPQFDTTNSSYLSGQNVDDQETNPMISDLTFSEWFATQMKNMETKNGLTKKPFDFETLKTLIQKSLMEHGLFVSSNGKLIDSMGNSLNMSNLHIRPLLIGETMEYDKLVSSQQANFVLPRNLPYLESLLVTLLYPPKIIGIIPMGKLYLPGTDGQTNVLSVLKPKTVSGKKKNYANQKVIKYVKPYKNKTKSMQFSMARKGDKKFSLLNLLRTRIKSKQNINKNNADRGSDETTPRPRHKDMQENTFTENDDTIPSVKLNNNIVQKQFNIIDVIKRDKNKLLQMLKMLQQKKNLVPNIEREIGSDTDHEFRIIGGNAATGSGSPISSRGRSGLLTWGLA